MSQTIQQTSKNNRKDITSLLFLKHDTKANWQPIFTFIIPVLLLFSLFVGCRSNDNNLRIEGHVMDPNQNISVQNAHVILYTKQMVNGTWSNAFTKKDETYTEADGRFSFSFEFNYTTGYKLVISKEDYFSISNEFTENDFTSEKFFDADFELLPKAFLILHLKNNVSFDENDKIRFHIINWTKSCEDCCSNTYSEFIGKNIDEQIICSLEGAKNYELEYIVTRNNNSQAYTKQFTAVALENVEVEIIY